MSVFTASFATERPSNRRWFSSLPSWFSLGCVGLLAMGCRRHDTGVVGPRGGTVEFDGGALDIPAGALDEEVTIEVVRGPNGGEPYMVGDHFTFSPSGLTFALPATLTFVSDDSVDDDEELVIYKWVDRDLYVEGDEMLSVHRGTYDRSSGEVRAPIGGFSTWGTLRAVRGGVSTSAGGSTGARAAVIPLRTPRPVEFEADWRGCRREFEVFVPSGALVDDDIWVVRSFEVPSQGFVQDYAINLVRGQIEVLPGRPKPAPDEPPVRYKFDGYANYGDWLGRRLVSPPTSVTVFGFEYVNPAEPANVEISAFSKDNTVLQWQEGELPPSVEPPVIDHYEITRSPPWPTQPSRRVDGDDTTLIRDANGDFVDVFQFVDTEATGATANYYLRAVNTRDCTTPLESRWSVVVVNGVPSVPEVPPNLEVEENEGRVSLSWGNVLGAALYRVYIGTDSTGYRLLAEVPREFTSFSDAFASAGRVTYRVTAVNDVGESDFAAVEINVPVPSPGPKGPVGPTSSLTLRGSNLSVYVDPAPIGAPAAYSRVYCLPNGQGESDAGIDCFREGQDVPHPLVYPSQTTVNVQPTASGEPLWRVNGDCERPGASETASVVLDGDRRCTVREPTESGQLRLAYASSTTCTAPLTVEVYEAPTGILVDTCVASAGQRCEYTLGDDTPVPLQLRLVAPHAAGLGVSDGPTDSAPDGVTVVPCPSAVGSGAEATIDLAESIPPGGFLRDYLVSCELTLDCP